MNRSTGNDIADNLPWPVTMRFGTVLLSCVLLALSCGPELTAAMAKHCYLCGLFGFACYFSLEFVAHQRCQAHARSASRSSERRLARRMRLEQAVAASQQASASHQQPTGEIESAMDSQADFDVFVGLQTQPTLSV